MKLDIFAALLAIAGAFLMVLMRGPTVGFAVLLLSCTAWGAWGMRGRQWALVVQQLVFGAFFLVGMWNSWLGPLLLG